MSSLDGIREADRNKRKQLKLHFRIVSFPACGEARTRRRPDVIGRQYGKGASVAPFFAQSERRTQCFEAATAWSAAHAGGGASCYEA